MTRPPRSLHLALIASLVLHLLPLVAALEKPPSPPSTVQALQATLKQAEPLPPATLRQEELRLSKSAQAPPPLPPPKSPAKPQPPRRWTDSVREQFQALHQKGLFYPEDARRQGIEGEVLTLLIIDEGGHVSAARVERSSGHRSLDEAALHAVRSLHGLPADAPRESYLPVRFRLR